MTLGPRLKDLGLWASGGTPPRDDEAAWEGTLPWLSAKDIDGDTMRSPTAFITETAAARHSRIVPPGSIVMIVRGMALAHGLPVVRTNRRAAFNQDLRTLVPGPAYEGRFLHYSLRGNRDRLGAHIDKAAHGTARVVDSIYLERLWVPSRRSQSMIADFLDRESARVTNALASLRLVNERVEEQAHSVVEQAIFGSRGDGESWFGSVPGDLPELVVPLGALGSFTDGDWVEAPFITDSGIRLIQTGNVGRGVFKGSSEKYITETTFCELGCTEVLVGDVLFSRLNLPMGRACLAPSGVGRMIASVDVAILRPEPARVIAEWLVLLASTNRWLSWLEQLARGTTMIRVARSQLAAVRLPVPDLSEQAKVIATCSMSASRTAQVAEPLRATTTALAEYRDALITEAVTGQLDVAAVTDAQMDERLHEAVESASP